MALKAGHERDPITGRQHRSTAHPICVQRPQASWTHHAPLTTLPNNRQTLKPNHPVTDRPCQLYDHNRDIRKLKRKMGRRSQSNPRNQRSVWPESCRHGRYEQSSEHVGHEKHTRQATTMLGRKYQLEN